MKSFASAALLTMLLITACTSDQPTDTNPSPARDTAAAPSTSGGGPGRGSDSPVLSESAITPSPFGGGLGRGPNPFLGTYVNDPTREGFDRQVTVDSVGPDRYRVRFLATELDGSLLCRHEVTFERRDTLELTGPVEGSTLRIYRREAALEVVPADPSLLRSPGLLCPGASIFGWLLPQWTHGEAFPDTLALPPPDEWLAADFLRDFNNAMGAAGQPDLALRYETEILTRGDFDGDGTWDYPVLLRDAAGRLGLFVYRPSGSTTRLRRVAALSERAGDKPAAYVSCGLDTEPAGTVFYDWSTQQRFTLPTPGILLQYYEAATVVFYLQGDRWRMVQVSE